MKIQLTDNAFFFRLWLFFHALVFAALIVSVAVQKKFRFDADFLNMLPATSSSKALRAADTALSKTAAENVFILVGHTDFQKAKSTAQAVFAELNGKPQFKTITMSADISAMDDIRDFIKEYRYFFQSREKQNAIRENPALVAENALARASGFSLLGLDDIENDPFMLSESCIEDYLSAVSDSGVKMSAKDGVLAREFEGVWYVMIRADLSEQGARLASKENAVPLIKSVCLPREKDGVRFVFYGTPFHSYQSSSSAQGEISVISAVSMAAVILLLLGVFKSGVPIAFSLLAIVLSALTALAATHAVFGKIHTLALVFGTSLVGSSIDYSLHFFINWKTGTSLKTGRDIRAKLFKGLFLSLISTEICYALLFFAPFGLIKQMAVFSFAGMLSTFLTAVGLFPLLPLPAPQNRTIPLISRFSASIPRRISRAVPIALAVVCACVIISKKDTVKIKNDISALYKMEGRLKDDTILAYKILEYSPASYLIVSGKSAESVLEKEEALCQKIKERGETGFLCATRFIPSVKSQKASLDACESLLALLEEQHAYLGFDESSSEALRSAFYAEKEHFFRIDEQTDFQKIPASIQSVLSSLYVGEVDGVFYSLIVPSKMTDSAFYADLAKAEDGVFFENKVASISAGLNELTHFIAAVFALAYLVIFAVLFKCYGLKKSLKIASIPLLSVATIVAVFALKGAHIEFFAVTGMILVFGLGLDYIIYHTEHRENREETAAIVLSFATTAISFGALSFSSFVPVSVLGTAILSGLSAAFIATIL